MPNPLTTRRDGDSFHFSLILADPDAAPRDAAALSEAIGPFLDEKDAAPDTANAIHTAIEELLTNLAKFGRPEGSGSSEPLTAEGTVEIAADGVKLRLADNGAEFDPTTQSEPRFTDDPDCLVPGGLGLHILRTMFSTCDYSRVSGKNLSVWAIAGVFK